MSLPQPYVSGSFTAEEYLAMERESVERCEYLDGEIYAMAGESPEHGAICINIAGQLYAQLRGKPCQLFSKDMKVRSGPRPERGQTKGLFSYPDLIVVCGELRFYDERRDVLVNPKVIIEVLSPATEAFDRGEKWLRYQTWLPELSDYVLVSQSSPVIEHFQRREGSEWLYTVVNNLEGSLHLNSINCTLQLMDVYDRVVFQVETTEEENDERGTMNDE